MVAGQVSAEPRSVMLASAIDLDGFRRACRRLWAEQVEPSCVTWHTAEDAEADLFETAAGAPEEAPGRERAEVAPVHAPAAFLPLAQSVVLHHDAGRFGLLYRLLWRLQVEPALRGDAL